MKLKQGKRRKKKEDPWSKSSEEEIKGREKDSGSDRGGRLEELRGEETRLLYIRKNNI